MAKTPTLTLPSSKVDIALTAGSVEPAMKAAGATSAKMFMVPLDKVREIDGFNVRVNSPDYQEHTANIANLIAANGFDRTKPLSGYVGKDGDDNVIYLTDGHTRLAAARSLVGKEGAVDKVPVVVHAADISVGELTERLHTSNNGRALTPFELGVVVKRRLRDEGVDKAALAGRMGVTPRYLDDVLLLVNSPKAVRDAVLAGSVSSTMAIQELRAAGDEPNKAVERITAAINKAKAAGKTKATAKDVGVKMKTVKAAVSIGTDTPMQDIVKAVAAHVRSAIAQRIEGSGDDAVKVAATDGNIVISITVPAPVKATAAEKKAEKAAAAAKAKADKAEAAAKAKAEKAAAAAKAKADKAAAKKPAGKKGAAKPAAETAPPVADDDNITAGDDDDLGIEGVEVASEGQDDEPAIMPPAIPKEGPAGDDDPGI